MSANEHLDDELQPDKDEVLQVEDLPPTESVPVRVEGQVRVTVLPNRGGTTFTRTLDTSPKRMVAADHRRRKATLMSIGANARFALSAASAAGSDRMALWPQNVPYIVESDTEIWACADTGTTQVSITTELWAEGDGKA